MKAIIKKTGEVIEVSRTENIITKRGVERQYVDNKRNWCTYVQSELEFIREEPHKDIDWEQRRYEIAKDITAALLSNPYDQIVRADAKLLSKWGVEITDALIAELKKGGEQ